MPATEIQAKVKIAIKNMDDYLEAIKKVERLTKELKDSLGELSELQPIIEFEKEEAASGN